jgi:Nif-specific regulatory protein
MTINIPDRYLKALVAISEEINSIQTLQKLLERILDIILRELQVDRGFILLKQKTSGQLTPQAVRNIDPVKISDISRISKSTIQKVEQSKKALLTFDTRHDDSFDATQSMIMHKIRSIACIPLVLKGKFIGLIYIDSQNQKAQFNQQTMRFLEAFANQAAIAIENARLLETLRHENELLRGEVQKIFSFSEIIGKSQALQSVFSIIDKVLKNDTTILLEGETGTGKELIARAIHYNGHRKEMPFVAVNCAAIPENLIESELFGYKKGAFTGALKDKKGLMEEAEGGTLFLDEIADIPLNLQVKLLRCLQEHEVLPLGGNTPIKIDVRIVAASNKNLQEAIKEGMFREDLFYRLNVISILLPPLRDRRSDIPLLAHYFLKKFNERIKKEITGFADSAIDKLMHYNWPGNVRELENTIERAVVLSPSNQIEATDIVLGNSEQKGVIVSGMTLEEVSTILLTKTLAAFQGNKTKAAEAMGVSLRWIHYKLKSWKINPQ